MCCCSCCKHSTSQAVGGTCMYTHHTSHTCSRATTVRGLLVVSRVYDDLDQIAKIRGCTIA